MPPSGDWTRRPAGEEAQAPLTYRSIAKFYYPLALTSFLTLGVHPILTFFIGKSRFAIESFAVLPVVNSLGLLFRSVGLSYQEVGVALMGKRFEDYLPLRNFALDAGRRGGSRTRPAGLHPAGQRCGSAPYQACRTN